MLNSTKQVDNQGSPLHEIKQEDLSNRYQHNSTVQKLCNRQCIYITFVIILSLILFVRFQTKMQEVENIETQMMKEMAKIQENIIIKQETNTKDIKVNVENIETQMTKLQEIVTKQDTNDIKLKVKNIETQISKDMAKLQQIVTKQETKDIKLKVENIETQMTKIEQKAIQLGILSSTSLPYTQQIFNPNSYKYDISKLQNPNQIIQVIYGPGEFSKMPLNTLQTNKQGKKIEEILYPTEDIRKERIQFQKHRKKMIKQNSKLEQFQLIEFNNPMDAETHKRGIIENEKQWLRMQKKYQLSKITKELPFCIIIPGYNNNQNFRIEHNLNSIFTQNYTNYKAIIIDDASTDGSLQIYRKYLQFYKIDKKYYTLISNEKKVTALPNHYFGTLFQCTKDSIALHVDADDQLLGRNSIKLFNWAYQTKRSGVIYSNYYRYIPPNQILKGYTSQYWENQKKKKLYRSVRGNRFSHLRSFRTQLLYEIDPANFQDSKGNFYTITYDSALFFPLMELSCGRVNKLQGQFNYIYNYGTGLNDMILQPQRQLDVNNEIKKKKGYDCWKQFDERMKK